MSSDYYVRIISVYHKYGTKTHFPFFFFFFFPNNICSPKSGPEGNIWIVNGIMHMPVIVIFMLNSLTLTLTLSL